MYLLLRRRRQPPPPAMPPGAAGSSARARPPDPSPSRRTSHRPQGSAGAAQAESRRPGGTEIKHNWVGGGGVSEWGEGGAESGRGGEGLGE